ncbi:MAG TPA: S8 family serine peptidase [Casimicrobiaceae bacterium]
MGNQSVTVVLQLAGDPVAVRQGNAGRKLSKAEKDQIKAELKGNQDRLRGNIQSAGASIVAQYQSAYNGIKVRVARDKLDQLAALPGVVGVRTIQLMKPDNIRGVPLIGAPGVWQSSGFHGEGIKIAVIDTGIDYTHANFGGPGTVAAYTAAHAAETAAPNPAWIGPNAPRIKGGIDLVGDSYNADPNSASYQPIPHPDSNPLDCNGHGSHVSGTAAGSGVLATGATYTGPYNATTISGNTWNVGPGVAPKANLYAVRVFGCAGSTDVTVDAIEWAVDNDMDVINMSLGSPFGSTDDPSAEATTNAAKSGVVVVTSMGNEGPNQYVAGSPGTAAGAIATAANDPWSETPGVLVKTSPPTGTPLSLNAINANGFTFTGPINGPIVVLKDDPTTTTDQPGLLGSADESQGCSVDAYTKAGIMPGLNQIAVVKRGACARVARAVFGQQAGAAVVIMANNAAGLPPFEGKITSNPDTGIPFVVTIPFIGVAGNFATAGTDSFKLLASPAGTTGNLTETNLPNANYTGFASFSSSGPRTGDSGLKPDITAPGVSITSTANGTGNGGTILSGTSMASPHVAGVAALTRQAHPNWSVEDLKAAIVNTGLPSGVLAYRTSRGGTGLVQPEKSTVSDVVARANADRFAVSLNFGFEELSKDYSKTKTIQLHNNGSTPARFNVAEATPSGVPHSVSISPTSVTVPANGNAEVAVTLSVPAATAGVSNGAALSFNEVAGIVQFTPAGASDNKGVALRVAYYLVPRTLSDVSTTIGKLSGNNPSTTATVTNKHGVIAGDADFYAWGLSDQKVNGGKSSSDVRAVGVQSFPFDAKNQLLVFAVNTYSRWSNAGANEFDIYVDVDGDGVDDYIIVGADQGAVQAGDSNGRLGAFIFSTRSAGAAIDFLATAPTDSSTAELPVLSSRLCRTGEPCLSAANPRLTYHIVSFDLNTGASKVGSGSAKYNAWSSAISQGGFATVAPGASDATNAIAVNSAEWDKTPAMGLMIVTLDNAAGDSEAQLIDVKVK